MRLKLVSDLHFEFHRDGGLALTRRIAEACAADSVEALVVAGDLADSRRLSRSLKLLSAHISVPILFVPGNHEYYRSGFEHVRRRLAKPVPNVHVLDNSAVTLGSTRFVGCTLWFPRCPSIMRYAWQFSDFAKIDRSASEIFQESAHSHAWLWETVRDGDVVITHHLPSPRSVAPEFTGSVWNIFYLHNQEALIKSRRPSLWLHGHTHSSCDYRVLDTRVVCNPYGYESNGLNPGFDLSLVLEQG